MSGVQDGSPAVPVPVPMLSIMVQPQQEIVQQPQATPAMVQQPAYAPVQVPAPIGFKDAAFVCTFGPSGCGKSVDAFASFPNAVTLAGTREFKSAITTLGYSPIIDPIFVTNLFEIESRAEELIKARREKNPKAMKINAVLADDFTVIAYQTEQALGKEGVQAGGKNLKAKGWDLWKEQKGVVLVIAFRIAEKLKQEGIHFIVNGHQRVGRTNPAGKFIRGGIDLPMDMTEGFCAGTNMMARIIAEPERLFQPTVFDVTNNDSAWATKNQFGLPAQVPSNTREILVNAGYKLPRAVGMEFHEEWVENLATYILNGIGSNPFTKAILGPALAGPYMELSQRIPNPVHIRWIIRDAVDRAWLRRQKRNTVAQELGIPL